MFEEQQGWHGTSEEAKKQYFKLKKLTLETKQEPDDDETFLQLPNISIISKAFNHQVNDIFIEMLWKSTEYISGIIDL